MARIQDTFTLAIIPAGVEPPNGEVVPATIEIYDPANKVLTLQPGYGGTVLFRYTLGRPPMKNAFQVSFTDSNGVRVTGRESPVISLWRPSDSPILWRTSSSPGYYRDLAPVGPVEVQYAQFFVSVSANIPPDTYTGVLYNQQGSQQTNISDTFTVKVPSPSRGVDGGVSITGPLPTPSGFTAFQIRTNQMNASADGSYDMGFIYHIGDPPATLPFEIEWTKDGDAVAGSAAPTATFSPRVPQQRRLVMQTGMDRYGNPYTHTVYVDALPEQLQVARVYGEMPVGDEVGGTYVGTVIMKQPT